MATVTVNPPKTPVTKGSSGVAAATLPNICKMPGPPAPFVPTPLPNIGDSGKSPEGYSTTVTIEGNPVAIAGASFGSSGDVASKGTGGGLISSNVEGPTKFIGPGSFNVQIEGKNVQLLGDPMLNNCGPSGSPPNAATMTGVIQSPGNLQVIYGDDKPCGRCGKTHPLEAGKETLEMMRTLLKGLKKAFEAQKAQIKELNEVNTKLRILDELCLQLASRSRKNIATNSEVQLAVARTEMKSLETKEAALKAFFKGSALLRWDRPTRTYSRGYMLGVAICVCGGKKLGDCSGNAPPALARVITHSGLECASPPVLPDTLTSGEWVCAAKQIVDSLRGHRPMQLIERWFAPLVKGLKPNKGPKIEFLVLTEDPITAILRVETRSDRFRSGQNVPSCDKCQTNLAELYCDTHCG